MKKVMYRHGDLLIESIKKIPESAKKRNSNIILEGEATNHFHRLHGGVILEKDDTVYLRVVEDGKVTHEEHKTITLPAGDYQVIRQREYDPYERAARQVQD
jgi:hypothetical protein